MRRWIAFLIVLVITAVLAGCGGSSQPAVSTNHPGPNPPNSPPPTPAPGPTPTPTPTPTPPPPPTPPPSPTDITGKVVDSATGNPVDGTVYVALEALQQDANYHIIALQQPDTGGNFDFKNVTATSSLVIVVTAMNNKDLFDDFYVPYILAGSDNAPNGAGASIKPGANVGTLAISYAPGPDAQELGVTIQSQTSGGGATAIIVNFTATTFQLDRHIDFPLPFLPQPSTTVVNGPGCSAGTACGTGQVFLPTSAPTIQYFQAQQIQGNPPSYAVFASATVPGSTTPDCQPPTQEMDLNASQPGTVTETSLVFNGCQ